MCCSAISLPSWKNSTTVHALKPEIVWVTNASGLHIIHALQHAQRAPIAKYETLLTPPSPFASVGLLISESHDSGDITYEIAYNLMMLFTDILFVRYDIRSGDAGDEVISKSYKYIDLLSADSSSVYFFSLKITAFFSPFHSYFLAK